MTDVSPSEVRIRALQEYELLRRSADELDFLAAQLMAGGAPAVEEPPAMVAVEEALAVAAKLLRELSDYVDLERLFVLPTLRSVDIWGGIRAAALASDHETRCSQLSAIEAAHRPVDPQLLAADLRAFVYNLRADLEREEREVLGTSALRDDIVQPEAD